MAKKARLTLLQSKFIVHYLANGGNGTQSARDAGYKGNDNVLAVTAYNLLRNPKIVAAIEDHMKEAAMSADEIIYRLTEQGRASLMQFAGLSPETLRQHPKAWLIKKVKQAVAFDDDGNMHTYVESFELHDVQAALVHLGKYHRLFTERVEVDWVRELKEAGLNPDEVEEELAKQFEQHILRGQKSPAEVSLEEGEGAD